MKQNSDLCPDCGQRIILKPAGESLLCFEVDGSAHKCFSTTKAPEKHFEIRPIGQSLVGQTIQGFHLRRRVATLVLSNNLIFEISAARDDDLVAMSLRLVTPDGILEE